MRILDFWDLVLAKHEQTPLYFGINTLKTCGLTKMAIERPLNRICADIRDLKPLVKQTGLGNSKNKLPEKILFNELPNKEQD